MPGRFFQQRLESFVQRWWESSLSSINLITLLPFSSLRLILSLKKLFPKRSCQRRLAWLVSITKSQLWPNCLRALLLTKVPHLNQQQQRKLRKKQQRKKKSSNQSMTISIPNSKCKTIKRNLQTLQRSLRNKDQYNNLRKMKLKLTLTEQTAFSKSRRKKRSQVTEQRFHRLVIRTKQRRKTI